MKNANKKAYPQNNEALTSSPEYGGLTKREKFAMTAMQGLVDDYGYHDWENMAHDAVAAADALLKELGK